MMREKLNKILEELNSSLDKVNDKVGWENLKAEFLGKKGKFTAVTKSLTELEVSLRAEAGKMVNEYKQVFTERLNKALENIEKKQRSASQISEWLDVSIDTKPHEIGALHPISRVMADLEDIFMGMGFRVMDAPHIETDYYNFEALNIPKHHPARDSQDTFYFGGEYLLRTQTSDIQIRAMEKLELPLRIIGPGKVFRAERIDASHECCFHQLEGMVISDDISVSHLIYFIRVMLSKIFECEADIRFRPGYFPFVEPGYEVEIACAICNKKGCRVCKQTGWIELMGCGMTHPNVLRAGGVDPEKYSGFAFGMGVDRLVMSKYGISDIRFFHNPDIRFHRFFQ